MWPLLSIISSIDIVGISGGSTANIAFYNSIHLVRLSLLCGVKLSSLLEETDSHLEVMTRFHNKLSMPYLLAYRETISLLIDKGQSTGSSRKMENYEEMTSNAVYAQRHNETQYFNKMFQAFWQGHSSRCHHYAKKALEMNLLGRHNRLIILFYAALNSFRGIKNNNGNGSQFAKVRGLYKQALTALRAAAELSPGNFSNKVFLVEAELHSFERKYDKAKSSYTAAITASCSSGYVHEHGLACEHAGLHYIRIGEPQTALVLLQQAKQSYNNWGSEMKVDTISQLIEKVLSMSLVKTK